MPELIRLSHRNAILCAYHNIITRIDTIPRPISNRLRVHAQGESTSNSASWHSPYTIAAFSARLRPYCTVPETRPSYTWTRRSFGCIKHLQQRCFTRGIRLGRGLGAGARNDDWDSLRGLWGEEVHDEQDRYQKTMGGPRREVVQVNNGEIELE